MRSASSTSAMPSCGRACELPRVGSACARSSSSSSASAIARVSSAIRIAPPPSPASMRIRAENASTRAFARDGPVSARARARGTCAPGRRRGSRGTARRARGRPWPLPRFRGSPRDRSSSAAPSRAEKRRSSPAKCSATALLKTTGVRSGSSGGQSASASSYWAAAIAYELSAKRTIARLPERDSCAARELFVVGARHACQLERRAPAVGEHLSMVLRPAEALDPRGNPAVLGGTSRRAAMMP